MGRYELQALAEQGLDKTALCAMESYSVSGSRSAGYHAADVSAHKPRLSHAEETLPLISTARNINSPNNLRLLLFPGDLTALLAQRNDVTCQP